MKRFSGILLCGMCIAVGPGCGDAPANGTSAAAPRATTPATATAPKADAAKADSPKAKPAPELPATEILSVLSVEHEVDVLAQRRGLVQELLADQGSVVQKGAALARLDNRELLAQLDKAKAELSVAQSNVKYNEAELRARQAALRRAQQMHDAGLNSQADLEEAEFRAKGSQHDLEAWGASVEKQRAEIRMIELELEKMQIRAPFGGVVVRRYLRAGQDVLQDDKCFRLSQLSPLIVRFLVPETLARRPRVGDTVGVDLAASARKRYSARIEKFSPVVDAASGSYDVTAQLVGPDLSELRPGMAVRIVWK